MSRLLMLSHRKWFIDLKLINFVFYQPVCSQGQCSDTVSYPIVFSLVS